jgi:hypothetical protein
LSIQFEKNAAKMTLIQNLLKQEIAPVGLLLPKKLYHSSHAPNLDPFLPRTILNTTFLYIYIQVHVSTTL